MLVRDLMQREIRTCRGGDSLAVAAELMWEGGCGSLPVVSDEGRIVAFLTDRDICMAVCREGLSPASTPVVRVASRDVLTVRDDDGSEAAEEVMRRHHVRRLPVVDKTGRPVGIVSIHDLAKQAHWAGSKGHTLTPESVIATEIAIGEREHHG